jgi:hypothetical protein
MRTETTAYQGAINNVFLPGTILLANIDVTGLLEYALKAGVGGLIWLGFKMAGEYLERKRKLEQKQDEEKPSRKRKHKKSNNGIAE